MARPNYQIIKNDLVQILTTGHQAVRAHVKKDGRQWKLTMWGLTENGWPTYEFTTTRREAIDRLRFIYQVGA